MNNQNNLKEEVKRYIAECGYDGLDTEMEVEDIARHFAKWKKEQMIEKAVKWLEENAQDYTYDDYGIMAFIRNKQLKEDFKKAMED